MGLKEQELFEYLKEKHFPDLVKSENTFDSFDCYSNTKNSYIELKSRQTHYPDLLIERSKYHRLVAEAMILCLDPWYINSTPEGVFGFDLTRVPEPAWEERRMPKTTEFANKDKIMKVVGFLHLDYAVAL